MTLYSALDAARLWLGLGCAVVPLQPNSKDAVRGYGIYGRTISDLREAAFWWDGQRKANIGLVLGRVVCLDFDRTDVYGHWRRSVGGNVQTAIEQTGRGWHVYLDAQGVDLPGTVVGDGLELKARGVVMVAPSAGPTGREYFQCTPTPLARFDWELVAGFLEAPTVAPRGGQRCLPPAPGDDLVSQIKTQWSVEDVAQDFVKVSGRPGARWLRGRCRFHKDRDPSFWLDTYLNLWGCGSTNCPQHGTHDVINLYALRYGLDVKGAIKEMARRLH